MFKVFRKEIEVAGKKISLETGKVARQADGAIIASCGETVILAIFFFYLPLSTIQQMNVYLS